MRTNPFTIQPQKERSATNGTELELVCPVCGRCQHCPGNWRYCVDCDEKMGVPMDDAPPETMKRWTNVGVWPSPTAGRA